MLISKIGKCQLDYVPDAFMTIFRAMSGTFIIIFIRTLYIIQLPFAVCRQKERSFKLKHFR